MFYHYVKSSLLNIPNMECILAPTFAHFDMREYINYLSIPSIMCLIVITPLTTHSKLLLSRYRFLNQRGLKPQLHPWRSGRHTFVCCVGKRCITRSKQQKWNSTQTMGWHGRRVLRHFRFWETYFFRPGGWLTTETSESSLAWEPSDVFSKHLHTSTGQETGC